MPKVLTSPKPRHPAPPLKTDGSLVALYFLLVATPIVLKLVGRTSVATWPWGKVLSPLWGPWLLLVALSLCGLLVRWASRFYDREPAA